MRNDWSVKKLAEVADFLDNQRKPVTASDRVPGPYPYYGANGQQDSVKDYIFDDELVLLAEDGGYFGSKTRPVAYRVSGKCWINNHAHVLKNKPGISDINFLGYSLMYYDVTPYISGTTRAKLNKSQAGEIPLNIPSIQVQKKIVDKLNAIKKAEELIDLQIQKTEELSESIMLNVVSKKEAWKEATIGEICDLRQGLAINAKTKHLLVSKSEIPLLRIKDLKENTEEQYIDSQNYPKSSFVNESDIIYTRTGQVGLVFTGRKGVLHNNSFIVEPKSKSILKRYLYWWLQDPKFKNKIQSLAARSSQPDINHSVFKKQKISLPSLIEQETAIAKLDLVQQYKKLLQKQKHLYKELFDSVLDKSMKGELN